MIGNPMTSDKKISLNGVPHADEMDRNRLRRFGQSSQAALGIIDNVKYPAALVHLRLGDRTEVHPEIEIQENQPDEINEASDAVTSFPMDGYDCFRYKKTRIA
jgi:hypothetical protein